MMYQVNEVIFLACINVGLIVLLRTIIQEKWIFAPKKIEWINLEISPEDTAYIEYMEFLKQEMNAKLMIPSSYMKHENTDH